MKKIFIHNSKGLRLAAHLYSVNSQVIVIMAHGFTNDKSSNGRFDRLAKSLNNINFDALAFDFSGCGESDEAALTVQNQTNDLNSAIDYVENKGYKKICLVGNSLGSLACLKAYREDIITMVLTGALTDSMRYNWDEYFTKNQLSQLDTIGFFYMDPDNKRHKIVQQTLKGFEDIKKEELASNVKCPILIMHGNNEDDIEELKLLERSKSAIHLMPEGSRLKIIEGAKHGFHNDWDKVIEITGNWLTKSER